MRRYRNQTGVQIRPYDWGGLGGLEALDPGLPQLTPIYRALAQGLKDEGYKERVDLFGAPYDFRLAADGLEQVSSCACKFAVTQRSSLLAALSACSRCGQPKRPCSDGP